MNTVTMKARMSAWLRPTPDSMAARAAASGWSPKLLAVHLLWSGWIFSTPAFTAVGPAFYWSIAISYPIFLTLFALVHIRSCGERSFYIAALLLLACFNMPFNPTAWCYGVFACAYVPVSGSRVWLSSLVWMLAIELALLVTGVWLGWSWELLLIMVGICTSTGLGAMLGRMTTIKRATERLSMAEVRRLAVSAERERIGRDLHDLLGHTLSLITMKLELSRKLYERDPDRAQRELGEAEGVARRALAEVRQAVTGIRATGLAGELASARLLLGTLGVQLEGDEMPSLPEAVDETFALVLREAVTNIHRHSRATRASVTVKVTDDHALMQVRDDGRGGARSAGNGLRGMRERIESVNGNFRIQSPPGNGTELEIDIPIPALRRAPATSAESESESGESDFAVFSSRVGERL